ncbi:MAG TPA: family 78 glycoside hydrolase catalytic domain [Cyclobacteriaceae bacterium]|nr:family 78 glycoside hydrolase catalytic domain [Cyclobacteriaceae bacterium]
MLKFKHCLTVLFLVIGSSIYAQVKVQNPKTENLVDPIGIDVVKPRFSWEVVSEKRNVMQTAYEIRVGESRSSLSKGNDLIWSSGKVATDESIHVPYGGPSLESNKVYHWQVRVWDNKGKPSPWSTPAVWQTAFLKSSDWKASWIQPGYKEDTVMRASPLFRKQFSVSKKILAATAYVTSHGVYEAHINGRRVGDAYLTPGWTSYNKRLQYQVYDITNYLQPGNNLVGAVLGSGWYRGYIGFSGQKNFYGKDISLLLQIEITYTDGTHETVVTDGSWKSSTGSIQSSEIYDGEIIDARLEKKGWDVPGYDDSNWSDVVIADMPKDHLLATCNELIRKHETFVPKSIFTTPKGEKVLDFGQNLVGWVIIKVSGKAGDKITIAHAEVLDKKGNFYTDNLREAKAEDVYTLSGNGVEVLEPHFTFHGFRYINVEGYPGELKAENFAAVALYSDMKPTGTFTSSNRLINQLQHNIQWGQKGNFLDVPTDCPQRDERLGWTGDAQAFSRTASFNMGVNNFFRKWLRDLEADQINGNVPFVIPNVLGPQAAGSAGWADAATIIPWNMYLAYGDRDLLADQYESMKAWVGFMERSSTDNLWNKGFHFGDWLFYRPFDDNDGRSAVTDKYLIAQCFFAHSTQLVINAAKVLGKNDDVSRYSALLRKVKDAFVKEYVTSSGRLVSSTQTAYVLALNFDMLPDEWRVRTADRLVENIKSYNNHLTTGFLGTPYLCHVLSRFGHTDVAYQLLMQESYPSWLYPVKMGATTIWERWDGIKPDSTFQTPGMNSYNHYAYGAIGDWMYRVVAGIDTYEDGVGYKHISFKPHPGGGFTSVDADLQTYYGKVSSHWQASEGKFYFDVSVPPNTTARVFVPAATLNDVIESGKVLSSANDIKVVGSENGYVVVDVGSGNYKFMVNNYSNNP